MDGKGGVYIKRLIEDGASVEDFKTELLGIYPKKECLDRETELAMTSLFPKGLNGNAGTHFAITDESRAKMSAAKKGKPRTEEAKSKIRSNNGTKRPEIRAKMSATRKGKPRSDEFKSNISAALKGRKRQASY